jgi:hypothetical protein
MTFAKCEIGKTSCKLYCDYSLLNTNDMAILVTHFCMPYHKKNLIKRKRTKNWSSIPHVNYDLEIYSRHGDTFIYINIKKSYKHELMGDTKRCVNHDGSLRRLNKDLATMNHASEKSKQAEGLASRYQMWWRGASEVFNLRYQTSHEESHNYKWWYLLNQRK